MPKTQTVFPAWKILVLWFVPLAILAHVYFPTFFWMIDRWMARDSYYGHGFLIPFISLYWIFKARKELAVLEKKTDARGLFFLLLGFSLQVVSGVLRIYFLSAISLVFILLGGALFLFGGRVFQKVWFPVFFLFLMIPLPLLLISDITLKMKFFVSEITAACLRSMGLPTIREGSYLHMRHSSILVGDPCSGLRSFLAFLCLGLVFAYGSALARWKRWVVALSGLPIALLTNVGRVLFLALLSEIYGMEVVHGWVHDLTGLAAFAFAMVLFLMVRRKLETFPAWVLQ